MTCDRYQFLLSEFTDDTLDAPTAWQVQTHLSNCPDCHRISREFQALRGILQSLPTQGPSAEFEAKLSQRLALTRIPEKKSTGKGLQWRDRLLAPFQPRGLRIRPALAFGFVVVAAAAFVWVPQHRAAAPPSPASLAMDQTFVSDCVAQHRRETAAEPLTDLAAQNLAGHLDSSTAAVPTATDGGLF